MNRRLAMSFTLSALLLGGTMVGCTHDAHVASASARDALGIVHSVQVVTTVSMLPASSGIASADASSNVTGTVASRARVRAMRNSSAEGSSPITEPAAAP